MRPTYNQPTRFFSSAKRHKFNKTEDINIQDLQLRPIIDQSGACTYNASKVITNYLKSLLIRKVLSSVVSFLFLIYSKSS